MHRMTSGFGRMMGGRDPRRMQQAARGMRGLPGMAFQGQSNFRSAQSFDLGAPSAYDLALAGIRPPMLGGGYGGGGIPSVSSQVPVSWPFVSWYMPACSCAQLV